ncbi:PhnD/SsuA/transferrin family substrate-binding protein [Alkalihalobacillus sp. 1P02AB]|uniref:PhnD/SsuA/transferrin family substrate-binding protein n=1 Tax=Alkalihalobacillus sp. 1P02AB TaxID=3132260 RepID=UPI0039A41A9B
MMKKYGLIFMVMMGLFLLIGCSGESNTGTAANSNDNTTNDSSTENEVAVDESSGEIDMVWYPNESGSDMKTARDEIGAMIEEATGKTVNHHLTTDYAIAIETIVNNNSAIAFMGAQGFIEAQNRNENLKPLVVTSGGSGTLDDAVYYSWLAVNLDEQDDFKVDGEFSLDTLHEKTMSFVSNSSTSGFKVPAADILGHYQPKSDFADLSETDLMEGGPLFSQVLFGNSHQGSAVNLLNGRADVAAFCDSCLENYVELVEGEENTVGAIYQVKDGAAEPFNTVPEAEFIIMHATPVLNAPFVVNHELLSEEEIQKLKDLMTSDEVANNEKIFVPSDSGNSGLFFKSAEERFVEVENEWFDPIRELSN